MTDQLHALIAIFIVLEIKHFICDYPLQTLYQLQNNLTWMRGNHLMKAGFDVRYNYVKSFFFPTIRGLLRYDTLQNFVNDVAEAANINKPLPGGEEVNYYRWWDQYYFVQDEWRVRTDLTLNLGLRYELPGNNIQSLIDLNDRILTANGGVTGTFSALGGFLAGCAEHAGLNGRSDGR